ncbi:SGNH/GDSL hydrolase family protein, partial [Klebsiella pneumoniae]|nr:SGNH/GDSL hydrolase family protein [Klebsiella pneumoniae]
YVVANGGLVKTGKSLITQQAITDIIQMIYNDTAGQSHGANLFDRDKAKEVAFINELGGLSDNAAYFASDRIPVLSSEKYVFSINVANLAFYDINGNVLSRLTGIIDRVAAQSHSLTLRDAQGETQVVRISSL